MKKIKFAKIIMVLVMMISILFTLSAPTYAASNKNIGNNSVLRKIKRSKKLVVGTSADYPPLEFTTSVNGNTQYVGVDMELAKDIAKDLHVKLVVKNMSFDSLLVALETGKVDMVISAMTPSPDRKKSVTFSRIYYKPSGEFFLINKKDKGKYRKVQDFKGKTVGAQTGSMQYQLIQSQMKGVKG